MAWTATQDAYIRDHYESGSTNAIAQALNLPSRKIRDRAFALGIKKNADAKAQRTGQWTPWHSWFCQLYPTITNDEMLPLVRERLGKHISRSDMLSQAHHWGVKKTPEILALTEAKRVENLRTHGHAGQFQSGNRPWNTGIKGYSVELVRSHYKPGNRPSTWVPVGTERLTGASLLRPSTPRYLRRKVAEPDVWQAVHHIVWQQHHGAIPEGYVVAFKDGNSMHTAIENLVCVSRSAHAATNRYGLPQKFAPLIAAHQQLQSEIEKQLNKDSQ